MFIFCINSNTKAKFIHERSLYVSSKEHKTARPMLYEIVCEYYYSARIIVFIETDKTIVSKRTELNKIIEKQIHIYILYTFRGRKSERACITSYSYSIYLCRQMNKIAFSPFVFPSNLSCRLRVSTLTVHEGALG